MNVEHVRVFYPIDGAKVVLRTDRDWDRDNEPIRSSECSAEFFVETDRPFFYFR
jgi:hypothetical protein